MRSRNARSSRWRNAKKLSRVHQHAVEAAYNASLRRVSQAINENVIEMKEVYLELIARCLRIAQVVAACRQKCASSEPATLIDFRDYHIVTS